MNGFSFPGLGGASATASVDGVSVAVNRHVCRSFGSTSNRCESSGANVGVSSLSASSKTYIPESVKNTDTRVTTSTKNLTLDRFHSPLLLLKWSTMRPGVAMIT